jgi:hypothetical protein
MYESDDNYDDGKADYEAHMAEQDAADPGWWRKGAV